MGGAIHCEMLVTTNLQAFSGGCNVTQSTSGQLIGWVYYELIRTTTPIS